VFEVFGRWALSRVELVAAVDNLFDVEWNEAQFATTSRLQDEPSPVTELHFTPGPGRGLQVGVEYGF
jgi:outer membrane receptor protein involved in Fe transport